MTFLFGLCKIFVMALVLGVGTGLEVEEWLEARQGADFMTVLWHQKSPSEVEFKFVHS